MSSLDTSRHPHDDDMLDDLLDALGRHRIRAAEGAVAAFLGRDPSALLAGRPRDARHSWIVNPVTMLPSGFPRDRWHPDLRVRPAVLLTIEQLDDWLRNPS